MKTVYGAYYPPYEEVEIVARAIRSLPEDTAWDNMAEVAIIALETARHKHHPGCGPYIDAPMDGVRNANPGNCLEGFTYATPGENR